MIQAKFSGTVSAMFARRRAAFSSQESAGHVLTVPPTLAWWYYQEWGTVGPYTIRPKTATQIVFFGSKKGELIHRLAVTHPGVAPKGFVRKVMPEVVNVAKKNFRKALSNKGLDNPALLIASTKESMDVAKVLVTDSIGLHLGKYQDNDDPLYGRLKGERAEVIFFRESSVVPKK